MFSESEISLSKELKRLGFQREWTPSVGQYLNARHCPPGCQEVSEGVHLILEALPSLRDELWLPRLDDLLTEAKKRNISFSQITDFLHRRRYADRAEREGLLTLFIELLR